MLFQEWDDELARQAQYSSAVCEFMRNEHRHDQSNHYDYVGENIGATGEQGAMCKIFDGPTKILVGCTKLHCFIN